MRACLCLASLALGCLIGCNAVVQRRSSDRAPRHANSSSGKSWTSSRSYWSPNEQYTLLGPHQGNAFQASTDAWESPTTLEYASDNLPPSALQPMNVASTSNSALNVSPSSNAPATANAQNSSSVPPPASLPASSAKSDSVQGESRNPQTATSTTVITQARRGNLEPIAPGDELEIGYHRQLFGNRYRLLPGDLIRVEYLHLAETEKGIFKRPSSLDRNVRVQPDGYVSLPYIAAVRVTGKTIDELTALLNEQYVQAYKDPQILVSLEKSSLPGEGSEACARMERAIVRADGMIKLNEFGAIKAQGSVSRAAPRTKRSPCTNRLRFECRTPSHQLTNRLDGSTRGSADGLRSLDHQRLYLSVSAA